MLHHHGGAGSPYQAPAGGTVPFSLPPPPPAGSVPVAGSIPMQPTAGASATFEEEPASGLVIVGMASAGLQEDELPTDAGAGGAAGASGSGGNRWPREETLALIRIRSEMDGAFRNAPLKAPLWEDVARKLAGLGYHRSAKKCKEKFENVDKYYRRTKEARAGRQDGKSYRFFSELEALHAAGQRRQAMAAAQADDPQPVPTMVMAWTAGAPAALAPPPGASLPGLSFSSMSGSSGSESDSDDELDGGDKGESGDDGGGGCDKEMMALFEGMMKQVAEKQEAMQRVFLETLERWEADRTAREEAWRRQEVARMNQEREQLARERAAAASRDAALIAFLQRVGGGQGQPVRLPAAPSASAAALPAPMPAGRAPPSPQPPPKPEEAWAWAAGGDTSGSAPSRWPKEEVHALIQLRTEKNEQDHDAGSKGPLWEDIAAGMRRIGYNRNAKRCKEKWENINKYYKKVKESNKRRPEDSKTCPYFHQLDAMYRKKRLAGRGSIAAPGASTAAVAVAAPGQENPSRRELEGKSSDDVIDKRNTGGDANVDASSGNGETALMTTKLDVDGAKDKRAPDMVPETDVQLQQREFAADETDSDDMGGNYTDEDKNEDKMQYKIGFQKPNATGTSSNAPAPETTAAATSSAAPTSSTFLAVQ